MWEDGTERPGKTGLCDQKVGTGTLEFSEETALSVVSPDWSYGLWLHEIEMAIKVGNIKKMWNYYIIFMNTGDIHTDGRTVTEEEGHEPDERR